MKQASIIIPTYNRAEQLTCVLEALTQQPPSLLDAIFVCDDGSSDHTCAQVASFTQRLPLHYLYQPDLGFRAGAARNLGIAAARTDLLIFIDDDCAPTSGWLEAHVNFHQQNPRSVAIGRIARLAANQPTTPHALPPDERIRYWVDQLHNHPHPWLLLWSCHFSYNRAALQASFDERFNGWGIEDNDFGYQLFKQGARFHFLEQAIVLHQDEAVPRSPILRHRLGQATDYSSFLHNATRMLNKYPNEPGVSQVIRDLICAAATCPNDGSWIAELV